MATPEWIPEFPPGFKDEVRGPHTLEPKQLLPLSCSHAQVMECIYIYIFMCAFVYVCVCMCMCMFLSLLLSLFVCLCVGLLGCMYVRRASGPSQLRQLLQLSYKCTQLNGSISNCSWAMILEQRPGLIQHSCNHNKPNNRSEKGWQHLHRNLEITPLQSSRAVSGRTSCRGPGPTLFPDRHLLSTVTTWMIPKALAD